MPALASHWDAYGWQTPEVKQILEVPENGQDQPDAHIHEDTGMALAQQFSELGVPVSLVGVDASATHARYHLLPGHFESATGKRQVSEDEMQDALHKILPSLDAHTVQLIQLEDGSPTITLMLRTAENRAAYLYEVLTAPDFVQAEAYTSIPLGIDADMASVVRDLAELKHLLIVDESSMRMHLQMSIALTLMLFNSPSYLRLALVGDASSQFRHLVGSAHTLGNIVTSTSEFRRLAEGLLKYVAQREKAFKKAGVDSIDAFNEATLTNKNMKAIPRVVVLLDTASIPKWRMGIDEWHLPLDQLLSHGPDVGIHVVMTVPDLSRVALPERIGRNFRERVVMRSVLLKQGAQFRLPPTVPLKFIDGILVDAESDDDPMTLEIPTVSEAEIVDMVKTWANLKERRDQERERKGKPATTGDTGLLTLRKDIQPTPNTMLLEPHDEHVIVPDAVIMSAKAMAAYLGWLSVGPLKEVLQLTGDEAEETLRVLQDMGILEPDDGPVLRYARPEHPPNGDSPE